MSLVRFDRWRLGTVLCAAALPSSCVREPMTAGCPDLAEGELAITEIRGPQQGSYADWLEVYNASDRPLALGGLIVRVSAFDGSTSLRLFVRDGELELAPGDYFVLGGKGTLTADYLDYDYTRDYHSDAHPEQPRALPTGGFFELLTCDAVVDSVRVPALPNPGSWFWAGEPGADANDDPAGWCVDDFTVSNTGIGARGTPGEANPPCP